MGTLDYSKDRAFKDAESAFQYLMQAQYKTVFLYNSVSKTLTSEIQKLYSLIREENSKVADMDNQWVATNPYYWDDIDGCLAVRCAEISISTVADTVGKIALFTGYNKSVLVQHSDEPSNADKVGVPGMKALSSLALLGYMASK